MKLKYNGKLKVIENGVQCIDDLIEYANDQYTNYKNIDRKKKKIDLLAWFSSEDNDSYLVDSGKYYLLLTNGPTTAYLKKEVIKNQIVLIGNEEA